MSSLVYVHNPNGTTYVYENVSYWDKATKKSKQKRKCVGKLMPDTGEVVPTRKKKTKAEQELANEGICTVQGVGPTLLLDKAAKESGLERILSDVFPDDWSQILTCAYYLAAECKPLSHVEQWSERNDSPLAAKLADQRVSELLIRITPTLQLLFFQKWAATNADSGYFVMDITSVSSYSEDISHVSKGYNRDKEHLPQINLLMLTCEKNRLPIYYRIIDGAVHDVSTVEESMKSFGTLQLSEIHLVMDRGFYSAPNIDALYGAHHKFSVGVPFTTSLARDAVERNRDAIDSHYNYVCVGQDEVLAVTERINWGKHRCYIHTFYNEETAVHDKLKFMKKLNQCYEELTTHNEQSDHKKFYEKFFIVKDYPKRARKVLYKDEEIEKYQHNCCGWFVIISNDLKDATAILRVYRQKDVIEKGFDNMKNSLDMRRLRVHSDEAMEGRTFIQFVAEILAAYLEGIMDSSGLSKSYDLREVFEEMKSIQQVSLDGRKKKYHTTPSKRQTEIATAFGISL